LKQFLEQFHLIIGRFYWHLWSND